MADFRRWDTHDKIGTKMNFAWISDFETTFIFITMARFMLCQPFTLILITTLWQSSSAVYSNILQVILYKDEKLNLPECSQSSIDTLADSVRQFLQSKVTEVVNDDDFIIGDVESAQNMAAQKGDGPAVDLNFKLKCSFCRYLGWSLRSDSPNSSYNVAYMLRWALQYYLEKNIKDTTDDSIKECLTEDLRILVKINQQSRAVQ
jgi:hypothetical protein